MIKDGTRQYRSAASVRRLPSRGNDEARRRAVLDSPLAVRSPLREAGSAQSQSTDRLRPLSIGPKAASANIDQHRQRRNPHSI